MKKPTRSATRKIVRGLIVTCFVWTGTARADLVEDAEQLETGKTSPAAQTGKPDEPVLSPPSTGTTGAKPGSPATVVKPAKTDQPPGKPGTPPGKPDGKKVVRTGEHEEVRFSSRGASVQKEKGYAELTDNVVVTQADMKLEAQKAQIWFDQTTNDVTKIIATGKVRMSRKDPQTGKDVKANGDEALFFNDEQKVILRGNAQLWRGGDLMKGRQITYEMKSGLIKVEEVEGVVQPGDK